MYITYLSFYAAISSEALARGAHPSSNTRLQSLEQARTLYEAAKRALAPPALVLGVQDINELNDNPDQHYTDPETTESDDASTDGRSKSTPSSACYSSSSLQSDGYIADTLFPKPPSIRSTVSSTFEDKLNLESEGADAHLSPRLSVYHDRDALPSPVQFQVRQQSLGCTEIWLRDRSTELYNMYLADFEALLLQHVEKIEVLITAVKALRASKHTRALDIHRDDEDDRRVDLAERIQRLKATGWSRPRFDPSRYDDLCEQALAEL